MDKTSTPAADQRRHFPCLQRGRNSCAGGWKPLSQQPCARRLFLWAGQRSAAVGPPAEEQRCFTVRPTPEPLPGHVPPRLPATGDGALWLSPPGLRRGARRAQPPRSSFGPGPHSSGSRDLQGREGREEGGDAAGAVQRCHWYLLKRIKVRETSLFLASFYPPCHVQVCQRPPGRGPGTPVPTRSHASACPAGSGEQESQKGCEGGVCAAGTLRCSEPPCCPGPAGDGGQRDGPHGQRGPPTRVLLARVSRAPAARRGSAPTLAGAGSPSTPAGASGAACGCRWLFSRSIYRCLTPPGAEGERWGPPPTRLGDCSTGGSALQSLVSR